MGKGRAGVKEGGGGKGKGREGGIREICAPASNPGSAFGRRRCRV